MKSEMLGKTLRDTVTGFQGTCTAHSQYLNSPNDLYLVEALVEGRPTSDWVPAARMEVVK